MTAKVGAGDTAIRSPAAAPQGGDRKPLDVEDRQRRRALLREDEEDLAAFSGRAKEKTVSYEQFLANWNAQ